MKKMKKYIPGTQDMLHLKPHSWLLLWSKKKKPHPSWIPIMLVVVVVVNVCHHHLHCHVFCSYRTYIYKKTSVSIKMYKEREEKDSFEAQMTCLTHHLGPFSSSLPSIPALHSCCHAGCAGAGCHWLLVQLSCGCCICCAGCCCCLLQYCHWWWWWWCDDVVTWWGIDHGGKTRWQTLLNSLK